MIEKFARAFPLWVTAASLVALIHPPTFSWFIAAGYVTPALQVIMLAMGLTLRAEDFGAVANKKALVALGVLLQFTIMPGVGYAVGKLLRLPEPLFAGLILVCCCPGGTASNVIAFLAKADVALSVAMTACSTLCAALVTPTLTTLLLNQAVRVDVAELYLTTAEVVLLPVLVGGALRRYAGQAIAPILSALPALAVVAIVLIVAGIIGVQRDMVLQSGPLALLAVTVVHGLAFLFSFLVAKRLRASESAQRTISIEVGMQNSGLGVVLARASFADPLVAVTPALSAIVHCLYGSALAAWWGRERPPGYDSCRDAP
jgi:bile acid:Na+ symporter, BASS family